MAAVCRFVARVRVPRRPGVRDSWPRAPLPAERISNCADPGERAAPGVFCDNSHVDFWFLCFAQHREATKNILEDEWFSSIAACFHDMRSHWAKPGSGTLHHVSVCDATGAPLTNSLHKSSRRLEAGSATVLRKCGLPDVKSDQEYGLQDSQ